MNEWKCLKKKSLCLLSVFHKLTYKSIYFISVLLYSTCNVSVQRCPLKIKKTPLSKWASNKFLNKISPHSRKILNKKNIVSSWCMPIMPTQKCSARPEKKIHVCHNWLLLILLLLRCLLTFKTSTTFPDYLTLLPHQQLRDSFWLKCVPKQTRKRLIEWHDGKLCTRMYCLLFFYTMPAKKYEINYKNIDRNTFLLSTHNSTDKRWLKTIHYCSEIRLKTKNCCMRVTFTQTLCMNSKQRECVTNEKRRQNQIKFVLCIVYEKNLMWKTLRRKCAH